MLTDVAYQHVSYCCHEMRCTESAVELHRGSLYRMVSESVGRDQVADRAELCWQKKNPFRQN